MSPNPSQFSAYYVAGRPSDLHQAPQAIGLPDEQTHQASQKLRDWARWFDANHDVVCGALDKLANYIVGLGIEIEPMVRDRQGRLLERVNDQIRAVLLDEDNPRAWARDVTVTGEFNRGQMEWTVCRTWLRDGDIFGRQIPIRETTDVPYQLQLINSDFLPYSYIKADGTNNGNSIVQGIEKNSWGRPIQYHFWRTIHSGLSLASREFSSKNIVSVPAREIVHLKYARRNPNQTRGVPIFHSAIFRLDDIHDFETAHRAATRAASKTIGQLVKAPSPFAEPVVETDEEGTGVIEMQDAKIFTDFNPGDKMEFYTPTYPNPDAVPFLDDQGRRVAAGIGLGWSTVWNKYDKSFSAARQEQSEHWPNIETLRAQFIADWVRPGEYEPALRAALQAGLINMPKRADPRTWFAADYRGPARPVIDDEKQAKADTEKIGNETDSRYGRIRLGGRNPRKVDAEIESDPRNSEGNAKIENPNGNLP